MGYGPWGFMGFPKSWGYPQLSSILDGFSIINHPFGVPPFMETPYLDLIGFGLIWNV
jgi:hypothetical protein